MDKELQRYLDGVQRILDRDYSEIQKAHDLNWEYERIAAYLWEMDNEELAAVENQLPDGVLDMILQRYPGPVGTPD